MTYGEKEEESPIPAVNSSSYFTPVSAFIILSIWYGGIDGRLFDDIEKDTPLYD